MKKRSRFLYLHKVIVLNLLIMGFILVYDPRWFATFRDDRAFNYYLGVLIILGLFFEFAGIFYKVRFIYSIPGARDRKIPWFLHIFFLPRVLFAGFIFALGLRGMGLLDISDLFLIPIMVYAAIKEFWVRSALMHPESAPDVLDPPRKVWMGEIMLFLYICISYIALWELWLAPNTRFVYQVLDARNYGIVGAAFLVLIVSLEIPYFVEERLRGKARVQKVIAILSLMLPVLAMLIMLFRIGYMHGASAIILP